MKKWQYLLFVMVSLAFAFMPHQLFAADPNRAKIEQTCKEYALEDKVSPDEMEAYIQQCVQDLLEIRSQEDTLPKEGDVPVPPAE